MIVTNKLIKLSLIFGMLISIIMPIIGIVYGIIIFFLLS